ncbi:MAG: DNA alkylation repair protein, partial [Myxococcales bacterium]
MEPFKNLLDAHAAARIAAALSRSWPGFPRSRFLADIEQALAPLELKQRMLLLASRLQDALPQAPVKSFGILCDAVQQDPDDEVGVSSFLVWPFTRYVAQNGLPHFDASMAALHRLTQAFTAEFDVRPFLVHHEARTLRQLAKWTEDDSEHVRRLVSEGSRPLLPWGERLPAFVAAPEKTWPLLEALRRDPSKYVQKSVANHLNDHTKHHGDWVVEGLRRWHGEARKPPSLDWIIRHGLRTLVKRGHPGALALLGVAGND